MSSDTEMLLMSLRTTSETQRTITGSGIRRPSAAMSEKACPSSKIWLMECKLVPSFWPKDPLIFISVIFDRFLCILTEAYSKSTQHCNPSRSKSGKAVAVRVSSFDCLVWFICGHCFYCKDGLIAHEKFQLDHKGKSGTIGVWFKIERSSLMKVVEGDLEGGGLPSPASNLASFV